jgi:predicted transcriptional regulator
MEVHFAPELQARIDQLLSETGYSLEQLVADAMAGYVAAENSPNARQPL